MSTTDLINVGLSEAADDKLDELKELGIFADKIDGYRFGISLAVAQGVIPSDLIKRKNLFNVGSLDPDQSLRRSVEALMPSALENTTVYRLIERLADWGVSELHGQAKSGDIDFAAMLGQVDSKAE
ncbi:MAG: hypothetical protein Q7J32_13775 [Sphingomonadaceae bacterium]|nr:hypothetical protein [Sphingomonadaceae bacterium]